MTETNGTNGKNGNGQTELSDLAQAETSREERGTSIVHAYGLLLDGEMARLRGMGIKTVESLRALSYNKLVEYIGRRLRARQIIAGLEQYQ